MMMKAFRTLGRLADRSIESSEVGLSDFAVLEMLLHKGPQPVNEIGRRIELTSGAITTAVRHRIWQHRRRRRLGGDASSFDAVRVPRRTWSVAPCLLEASDSSSAR